MDIDFENLTSALVRAGVSEVPKVRRPGPEDALRVFIRSAALAGGTYELLALKLRGGPYERDLRALASQELDTERTLQGEFFSLTGDTLALPPVHPSAPSVLGALRSSAAAEKENAERYEAAAELFPDRRELFLGLASRERRHSAALTGLARRAFGGASL